MSDPRTVSRPVRLTLSDQLRNAIAATQISARKLAEDAGLNRRNVDRFVGGGDLKLSSAGRIAACLGLTLESKAKRPAPKAAPQRPRPTTVLIPEQLDLDIDNQADESEDPPTSN